MTQTIIGIFESYGHARDAADELIKDKFRSENVSLHSIEADDVAEPELASSTEFTDANAYPKVLARIENFLSGVFGDGDKRPEAADHYAEAVRRGAALVSAEADTEDQVAWARAVLCRAGALNLDVCVATWRGEGYERFDPAAPPLDAAQWATQRELLRAAHPASLSPDDTSMVWKYRRQTGGRWQ